MDRRRFLLGTAALAGCGKAPWREDPAPNILQPGMAEGHWLRDARSLPHPNETLDAPIVILGSGVAGLSCTWALSAAGFHDFVLVSGPEADGNAASGMMRGIPHPRGAHYLPLPSMESRHVREMLFDLGVLEEAPWSDRPRYDEAALVAAPAERMLIGGQWQEGLLPGNVSAAEKARQQAFFDHVEHLKEARGRDGKKAFAIPRVLSSADPAFTALDDISMAQWLVRENFDVPSLRWLCDYACRDDYGMPASKVSAWAGLHYFAARGGQAANAEPGAVLTWPAGLGALTQKLRQRTASRSPQHRTLAGFAVKVKAGERGVESWVMNPAQGRITRLTSRQVVLAMPLMVAARVLEGASDLGLTADALPTYAPWMVANVALEGLPRELPGAPLAWDNVIHGSVGLGYVVATHQLIRQTAPQHTVLTAYHALGDQAPAQARQWLLRASAEELMHAALSDLHSAYPGRLMRHAREIEITLRGHAMSTPLPGFLSRPRIARLQQPQGRVHFAHADLSGMSLFEEAAWWGVEVARRLSG
jgi:protoporphyrinogen oxidase